MLPSYHASAQHPGIPRIQLSDDEVSQLKKSLRILNELRGYAERHEADELRYSIDRASEVLAALTRHRGEVFIQ